MKKRNNKKYIILIIVIIIAIMLGITVKDVKEDKKLNFFEKAIKDSGTLVVRIVAIPFKFTKEKIVDHKEKNKMYKEYKKLKNKAEKSDSYLAEIRELQSEITSLKKQLELDSVNSEYTYIHASIVNRNVNSWYNTLTIDKGSRSFRVE